MKLLPKNDQTCGWINSLEPRKPFPVLKKRTHADWVIIGGGYTGLAFARRMAEAKPQAKIIIVDACAIGEGASARNSGFAVATSTPGEAFNQKNLDDFIRINRINNAGIDILRGIVRDHQIECQWSEVGKYHCGVEANTQKNAEKLIKWLEASGTKYEELSKTGLSDRLGTPYYQYGVRTIGDVLLQPAALVRGLSRSLPDNVELYDHSPVIRISDQGDKIHLECPEGEVIADKLVMASNSFLHTMTPKPSHTVPLTLTASLTKPLNKKQQASIGNPQDWGILSLNAMGATVRYTQDHRILVRNTVDYKASAHLNDQEMNKARQKHQKFFQQRFPMLSDLKIENSWQGSLCISRNSTSIFGRFSPRIYGAGCYNAAGVSRGTAFGLALADFALGEINSLVDDILQYPKPKWMPPRPLLDLVMKSVIWQRKFGLGADE